MNKKYKYDSDGNLVVITDTGEIIEREDKYTKGTDLILSLENVIESLKKKRDYFKEMIDEIKSEYKKNIKNIFLYTIISVLAISFLIFIYSILSITVLNIFISIFLLSYIATFIPDVLKLLENKKEINEYVKKMNIEEHKINKINKRINMLSRDNEIIKLETDNHIKIDKINNYIDVKDIYNYYDVLDYFIMNYMIDKNIKKENPGKKRVRKLTKEDNRIYKM